MITAIVQFSLPKPISLEEATRAFESTRRNTKTARPPAQILFAQRGRPPRRRRLSVGDAPAAEAVYNGEWKARVKHSTARSQRLAGSTRR